MNLQRVLGTLPGRVLQKFLQDQAPNWAVVIAWNGLFAMFPIIIFASSILGFVLNAFGVTDQKVYGELLGRIPDQQIQRDLANALTSLQSHAGLLFLIGTIGLLWGGSALFGAMEQAFAVIYHLRPRDFVRQKLVGFAMVLLFTVLVGLAVASASILPALQSIPGIGGIFADRDAAFIMQILLGAASGFTLFLCIYFVVPNRHQKLTQVWPGALLAGVLFEAVTMLFPLYLTINKGTAAYGAFGLFLILLTFFFFFGLITMLGVELNSVLYPESVDQSTREPVVPLPAGLALNGHRPGLKPRTVLGLAIVASVIGVLIGRRSAGSN
jgi:membrane protein